MRAPIPSRLVSWLLAAVAGAVFGVAGTISHPVVAWGRLPIGLIAGGAGCLALLVAIRLLVVDRGAVLAAGLGMLAALTVYSGEGPGGSVVVPQAAEGEFPFGVVWSVALAGIVLAVVAWPRIPRAWVEGHTASQ
ncbi:histidinol dehydrogenase [Microbacterium sp. ZXX196]|uniref:histidinol dehydrogenase n=1 Tax=Microbacterium sp. ZXX196 TaxID=2609291 RepID=UPI0012B9DF4C|nr:histidinol dehydrogenase [Microbacterium sp. ZXX196]MTE22873.1 histidinol dehydrogenase [Microbacterium sp. ZXX196]